MTRKELISARILFVLYLGVVAWLCFGHFSPQPHIPRSILGIPSDKIAHFAMFLPFPILAYFAFDRYGSRTRKSIFRAFAALIAGVAVAATTEVGQARLTTYRTGDPADFRADLLALALGTLIVFFLVLAKKRKS